MKINVPLLLAGVAVSVCACAANTPTRTDTPPASLSACSRFQPGHYIHIADDKTRNLDGLAILRDRLAKDVHNFKGVVYQMPWGMLEKSPGDFDFRRLDAALAQVKAKNMYLFLKFEDRTFWTGCNSDFLPAYVQRDGSAKNPKYCIAKVWEPDTVDNMIRVLQQIALRYRNDPNFLGIDLEETSIDAATVQANKKLYYAYYDQLKRMHAAVHSAAPNLIINQNLNWPVNDDVHAFYDIADNLVAMGGGGAVGWPDTLPAGGNSYRPVWSWYQVGRDYNRKLLIMPYSQAASIDSSLATADKIYNMLNNDIQAHMIVWAQWHKDMGGAYFTEVVIPTVNKYNGSIKNTTCPFH